MRKSFHVNVVAIILCIIALLTMTILPGCAREKVTIPQELDKLSLGEMWEQVEDATGLQDGSSELESLNLHTDENGKIDSLSFVFHGYNTGGRPEVYFVSKNSRGELNWHHYESESITATRSPSKVFAEIDNIGLSSLQLGDAGLAMQVDFISGDIGYSYDYSDIYHLESGTLKQLDEIVFHSKYPWCTISVYKLSLPEPGDGKTITQNITIAAPVPRGERTSQIWFLSDDINKADVVKYLEKTIP